MILGPPQCENDHVCCVGYAKAAHRNAEEQGGGSEAGRTSQAKGNYKGKV
jgi:hypothetical protein